MGQIHRSLSSTPWGFSKLKKFGSMGTVIAFTAVEDMVPHARLACGVRVSAQDCSAARSGAYRVALAHPGSNLTCIELLLSQTWAHRVNPEGTGLFWVWIQAYSVRPTK